MKKKSFALPILSICLFFEILAIFFEVFFRPVEPLPNMFYNIMHVIELSLIIYCLETRTGERGQANGVS
jgi:hypothetical protein